MTLVHRRERLSGSIKYWVKPDIENRIVENAIAARFESQVVRIGPTFVEIEGPEGREEIPADAVFLLTGYRPDTALLARAGVRVDARTLEPEHDPQTLETNVPGLFVAGRDGRRLRRQPRLHRERPLPRHERREARSWRTTAAAPDPEAGRRGRARPVGR